MGRAIVVRESREMVLAYFEHYQSVCVVCVSYVCHCPVVFKNTRRRHLRPGTLQRVHAAVCMRVPTRPICSGPPAMARAQAQ
jgi:hypothetical protein